MKIKRGWIPVSYGRTVELCGGRLVYLYLSVLVYNVRTMYLKCSYYVVFVRCRVCTMFIVLYYVCVFVLCLSFNNRTT